MPTNFMEIEQPPAKRLRMVNLATGDTITLDGAHFAGVDPAANGYAPRKVRFADGRAETIAEIRAAGYEVYAV